MSHRKHKPRRSPRPIQAAATPLEATVPAADADTPDQQAPTAAAAPVDTAVFASSFPESSPSLPGEATPAAPLTHADHQQDAIRIGMRFKQAREAGQLEITDLARRLKLPHRVLEKLEAGDWIGIDSPLYLRGYLRSYSNLLGIEPPEVELAAPTMPVAPPLVSTGGIPRSHYLWHRYTTAATYLVLTALVVVPTLLLGLRGGLKQDLSHLVPLDPPSAVSPAHTGASGVNTVAVPPLQAETSETGQEGKPLMASMAPVSLLDRELEKPAATTPRATTASGVLDLVLHLDAPSWVEIHGADGKRIEYALLEPGDHRYSATGGLDVRLGNSQNAALQVDGQARDLEAYRRANVAHFLVDADGKLQPPQG